MTAGQEHDWEVVVMVGPCTEEEAAKVFDEVAEFIYARGDFDATVVIRPDADDRL